MERLEKYISERLDHLEIVAGICQEIGLAAWVDAQEQKSSTGERRNGNGGHDPQWIGISLRQLYLVPQFFANKPVEHLLRPGITAECSTMTAWGAPGLAVRPRSDQAVCWDCQPGPTDLWPQG